MSLVSPTFWDKVIIWLKTPSASRKVAIYCLGALIVFAGLLFAIDRVSGWRSNRQIDKLKANVNVAMQDLQQAQTNIAVEKKLEQQALENVNVATKEYADAVNATVTAKTETNRALQNLASAVNGNRPVNITVNQLEQQLKDLER